MAKTTRKRASSAPTEAKDDATEIRTWAMRLRLCSRGAAHVKLWRVDSSRGTAERRPQICSERLLYGDPSGPQAADIVLGLRAVP